MPLTPDEIRQILLADAKQMEMNRCEDLARLAETEHLLTTRQHCADRYRELIGVNPSLRHALRRELQQIRHTRRTVAEATARVAQAMRSGPSGVC